MAGALLVSGAAVATLGARTAPTVTPAIDAHEAAALVDGDLRDDWSALDARATTLAQLPRLVAAISTDAATVENLTTDELAFQVQPGETVQLAQRRGTELVALGRLPASTAPLPLALGQQHLEIQDGAIAFVDCVPVAGGALAVRWRLTPAHVFQLVSARTAARIVVGDQTVLVGGPFPATALTVTHTLVGPAGTPITIAVPATESTSMAATAEVLGGGGAASVGGGLLLLGGLRRRRRQARLVPRAVDTPARRLTPGLIPTQPIALLRGTVVPIGVGAALAAPASVDASSTRLGRYEPVQLLGTGGTSSVFLARALGDEGFERKVALKILRADYSRDPQFREMFLDEARLAAAIDHPNVVQILDLGHRGDELYIAMEHIDGDDLESVLSYQRAMDRATPVPIALAILRRLCDGLHAAHTAFDPHGIPLMLVHRDVKPANVMISRNGEVKVGDFGIAKASQQLHISRLGETKGTVQFMAPEQRRGQPVDARTDVFGVAAVAYEMIIGVAIDLDLARLLKHGLTGWPHLPPIADYRPETPAAIEPLLRAALAYKADDRPESCAVLEASLGAVMEAQGWNIGKRELAAWLAGERRVRTRRATGTDEDDEVEPVAATRVSPR